MDNMGRIDVPDVAVAVLPIASKTRLSTERYNGWAMVVPHDLVSLCFYWWPTRLGWILILKLVERFCFKHQLMEYCGIVKLWNIISLPSTTTTTIKVDTFIPSLTWLNTRIGQQSCGSLAQKSQTRWSDRPTNCCHPGMFNLPMGKTPLTASRRSHPPESDCRGRPWIWDLWSGK